MEDDISDILGQELRPVVRVNHSQTWSNFSSVKLGFYLVLFLVGYLAVAKAWEHVLKWRERSYKLAMRRRHGIPDNDHRPFNVAYAAVVRAREEEAGRKAKPRPERPVPTSDQRQREQNDTHRPAWGGVGNGLPGRFDISSDGVHDSGVASHGPAHTATDRYAPTQGGIAKPNTFEPIDVVMIGPARHFNRRQYSLLRADSIRIANEQSAGQAHKRDDGHRGLNGVSQRRFTPPIRVSKRVMEDEEDVDDEDLEWKRARDKRARKFSLEKPSYITGEMDVDDEFEDEVADLPVIARGKKRDRAEAGSTFGGDDEDEGFFSEYEDVLKTRRRQRKRQTVSKRKSDVGSHRGKKRDRDLEDEQSEDASEPGQVNYSSRKKRGRKNVEYVGTDEDDEVLDLSLEESPSVRGRRRQVGEEWESGGVRYKIGPNGQRLRQALVKKARQKFPMPQDSHHPDRDANLEVCIETWLTEAEYKDAKAQHLLAWQDSPSPSVPARASIQPQDNPAPVGKDLLWRSTISRVPSTGSTASVQDKYGKPVTRSLATTSGLRLNPFQQAPSVSGGKRIASARVTPVLTNFPMPIPSPISPSLTDATNTTPKVGPRHRTFSKWEKQDLEASAMMKMREVSKKTEAEKLAKEKEENEKRAAAAAAAAAPPAISFTPSSDAKVPPAADKTSIFSWAPKPSDGKTPESKPAAIPTITITPPKPSDEKKPPKPPAALSFPAPPSIASAPVTSGSSTTPSFSFPPSAPQASTGPSPVAPPVKPSISFGQPASSATPASLFNTGAASSAETKPSAPSAPATDAFSRPNTGSGSSLLSRIGPIAQDTANKPAAPAFSFGPTAGSTSTPSPFTSVPTQPTPSSTTSAAPSGTGSAQFKFNFPTSAPSAPAPPTTAIPASLTTTSAPAAAEPPKSNSFSFKPTSSADSAKPTGFTHSLPAAPQPAASSSAPAVKFNFSAPAAPLAPSAPSSTGFTFGSQPAAPSAAPSAPTDTKAAEAPKSTFTFSGASAASGTSENKNIFSFGGAKPAGGSPFTFGASAPKPAAGSEAPTMTFGGAASSSEAPKPLFSGAASSEAPKPLFGNTGSGASDANKAQPSFSFGSSTAPGATQSGFSFGKSAAPSTQSNDAIKPAAPAFPGFGSTTQPAFGSTAGSSVANPFGMTTGDASKVASGSGAPATNPAAPSNFFSAPKAPSAAPPSAFTFGSTQSAQNPMPTSAPANPSAPSTEAAKPQIGFSFGANKPAGSSGFSFGMSNASSSGTNPPAASGAGTGASSAPFSFGAGSSSFGSTGTAGAGGMTFGGAGASANRPTPAQFGFPSTANAGGSIFSFGASGSGQQSK
ncbi:hypothetical protein AX16_007242 [Volvariella volvacea WC 439]|nr:hypothetical protein AX16_007242 [Volvariella volvacea WC 439]